MVESLNDASPWEKSPMHVAMSRFSRWLNSKIMFLFQWIVKVTYMSRRKIHIMQWPCRKVQKFFFGGDLAGHRPSQWEIGSVTAMAAAVSNLLMHSARRPLQHWNSSWANFIFFPMCNCRIIWTALVILFAIAEEMDWDRNGNVSFREFLFALVDSRHCRRGPCVWKLNCISGGLLWMWISLLSWLVCMH